MVSKKINEEKIKYRDVCLTVLVFQLKVYYKVDRLLTGLTAQQKGKTAWWYSNKTTLSYKSFNCQALS